MSRRRLSEPVRRRRAIRLLATLQRAAAELEGLPPLDLDQLDPAWRGALGDAIADVALELVGRAASVARRAGAAGVPFNVGDAADG